MHENYGKCGPTVSWILMVKTCIVLSYSQARWVSPDCVQPISEGQLCHWVILILITAIYIYKMLVVTSSHKGAITQLEYKLYFKSQKTTRFITLRPLVVPLLHSGATACMRKAGILLKHNLKMGIATAKCTLGKLYM